MEDYNGSPFIDGPSIRQATRHLRDVLLAKNYEVTHREYIGGHAYVCWRESLADALMILSSPFPSNSRKMVQ